MNPSGELMSEPTRLEDIEEYNVSYKPNGYKPALWDCPTIIREAALGKTPPPRFFEFKYGAQVLWPHMLWLGVLLAGLETQLLRIQHPLAIAGIFVGFLLFFFGLMCWGFWKMRRRVYAQEKELFGAFEGNPNLYRDEIFKAAVCRLPVMDFFGKHRTISNASKVGRYEADVIEELRKLGIRQETTVENRGRPFLIHQYELTELKWGQWENGDSKNYVLDIAILWPERRIKYNIEVDDPSHNTRPLKDINRDQVLTGRGWFVRRFNHAFFTDKAKVAKALREIVSIIYFFAKYANDVDLGWDERWLSRVQGQRFADERKAARQQKAGSDPNVKGKSTNADSSAAR